MIDREELFLFLSEASELPQQGQGSLPRAKAGEK